MATGTNQSYFAFQRSYIRHAIQDNRVVTMIRIIELKLALKNHPIVHA